MSETKHTPGPWAYSLRYLPRHCVTVPRNSADVALAEVFSMDTGEREANARLIAAAPDLLAAVRALLPEGWDDGAMDHMPGVKAARLAIAKAEGK